MGFTGIAETVDGFDGQFKFRMTCTTSNQQFQADGRTFSPYQMKCDIELNQWNYASPNNQLALVAFIASATAREDTSRPQGEPRLRLGNNGFFQWEVTADGTGGSIDVDRNEVLFRDESIDLDPTAPGFVTFFSFLTPGATAINWDPEIDSDPVASSATPPAQSRTSGASSVGASLALLLVALLGALCPRLKFLGMGSL